MSGNVAQMSGGSSDQTENVWRSLQMGTLQAMSGRHKQALAHAVMLRREELGMTQKELAKRVGVSERTMSRWEHGQEGGAVFANLEDLSEQLQTTPEELLQRSLSISGYEPDRSGPADEAAEIVRDLKGQSAQLDAQLARSQNQIEEVDRLLRRLGLN